MDYLEGLLLGSQWSDTDFTNRRHISSLVLYGVFVNALILMNYLTGKLSNLIQGNFTTKLILYLILFVACPFICFRYYRFPIWAKIPILIVQTAKQVLLTLLMLTWARPKITLSSGDIKDTMIEFLNSTLESHTLRYRETAGTFATVVGVLSGGVYIVFMFLAIAILVLVIPGLVFVLVRMIQLGYDKLVAKFILANHLDR
ncbi:MAG: hypothetical protein GX099_06340 [Clostridiaceae bacterium]|nr:hypothetical protein [Oscillospiraceae bacterium]NLO63028.1 hypothetical protein [Clostridiaceae bacterium]